MGTQTTTRAKQIWAVHLPDLITPRPVTEPEAPRRATLVAAVVVATAATTTRHTSRRGVPHTRRQEPTTAAGERDPTSLTRQQLQPVVSPKTPRQRHDEQQPFFLHNFNDLQLRDSTPSSADPGISQDSTLRAQSPERGHSHPCGSTTAARAIGASYRYMTCTCELVLELISSRK